MRERNERLCGSQRLQPLREIGLLEKSQNWDMEEIQAALREAFLKGISVESLYGTGGGRDRQPRGTKTSEHLASLN